MEFGLEFGQGDWQGDSEPLLVPPLKDEEHTEEHYEEHTDEPWKKARISGLRSGKPGKPGKPGKSGWAKYNEDRSSKRCKLRCLKKPLKKDSTETFTPTRRLHGKQSVVRASTRVIHYNVKRIDDTIDDNFDAKDWRWTRPKMVDASTQTGTGIEGGTHCGTLGGADSGTLCGTEGDLDWDLEPDDSNYDSGTDSGSPGDSTGDSFSALHYMAAMKKSNVYFQASSVEPFGCPSSQPFPTCFTDCPTLCPT